MGNYTLNCEDLHYFASKLTEIAAIALIFPLMISVCAEILTPPLGGAVAITPNAATICNAQKNASTKRNAFVDAKINMTSEKSKIAVDTDREAEEPSACGRTDAHHDIKQWAVHNITGIEMLSITSPQRCHR